MLLKSSASSAASPAAKAFSTLAFGCARAKDKFASISNANSALHFVNEDKCFISVKMKITGRCHKIYAILME